MFVDNGLIGSGSRRRSRGNIRRERRVVVVVFLLLFLAIAIVVVNIVDIVSLAWFINREIVDGEILK